MRILLFVCSKLQPAGRSRWNLLITILLLGNGMSCSGKPYLSNEALEGTWYIEFKHNDIGLARTTMTFETQDKTFVSYTRKQADKDILGMWTSFLGRTFTKSLKEGSLLRIEQGIWTIENDTLQLAGILATPMGNYNIDGYVADNRLFAKISNKRQGYVGAIRGSRNIPRLPMEDYKALFERSISLTEQNIYNPDALRSEEWEAFRGHMRVVSAKVQDDLEMVFAFFYYARNLPFSHYALMKLPDDDSREVSAGNEQRVFLEQKTTATAYLKINSFDGSASEMDSVFDRLSAKGYQHLIVDMRNNPGGSIEGGMAFARHLADTPFLGGVFLTQRYFNNNKTLPAVAGYDHFPHFTAANYHLILDGIHNTEGLCLKIIPDSPVFRGSVYILTNNKTASTCEPIVYGLKKRKRAVIVGEKTAGAMLNGEFFDLDRGFKMIIPTADYYASDGFRIDQKGVKPDIEINPAEALNYVLTRLID